MSYYAKLTALSIKAISNFLGLKLFSFCRYQQFSEARDIKFTIYFNIEYKLNG